MGQPGFRGLRRPIALLALGVSAVVSGLTLALIWGRTESLLANQAGAVLEVGARAHLATVVDNLARCRAAVVAGAAEPWVVALLLSGPGGAGDSHPLTALDGACSFEGWAVLALDGRPVAHRFRDPPAGLRAMANWAQRERDRTAGASVSWVGSAGPSGKGALLIAAPIQAGRASGQLVGLLGPEAIARWLPREPTAEGSLHWLLMDPGGRLLATSGIATDLAPLGAIATRRADRGDDTGGHGAGATRETPWVFGYAVDRTQARYVLAAFMERHLATAGRGRLYWQAAALAGALALLALACGAAVGAILSARIVGFAAAIDGVGRGGSLALRVEGGGGELGRLGQSINAMLESLSKKTADLIRRAEDARETHRATTQLIVSGLAHQLNNPLSGMMDCIDELRSDSLSVEARQEYVELISRGLDRINHIVSRLSSLEVTGGDADSVTEVEPAVRAVIGLRYVQIERMALQVHLSADAWLVVGADATVLSDIVDNLLSNAIAASPRGGSIEIDLTQKSRETVALRVRDRGVGMRPEELRRVGEPFYSRRKDGVGLGMWTVRTYVEALGGTIEVASAPSEGTTVTVTLPGPHAARG